MAILKFEEIRCVQYLIFCVKSTCTWCFNSRLLDRPYAKSATAIYSYHVLKHLHQDVTKLQPLVVDIWRVAAIAIRGLSCASQTTEGPHRSMHVVAMHVRLFALQLVCI